jgi:hypothetical protein
MQRERPYLLDVELARGTISQVRNHLAIWEPAGLTVPPAMVARLAEANEAFSRAAALQHEEPAAAAEYGRRALNAATDADAVLGETYAQQTIAERNRETAGLTALLGVNLGPLPLDAAAAEAIEGVFQLAVVPVPRQDTIRNPGGRDWRTPDEQIGWCQKQGIRVCVGPLLQLDTRGAPDRRILHDGDFEDMLPLILDHVRAVVTRYRSRVQVWQVAARMNVATALALTEHERLDMLVRTIETVRELDPQTALFVSIDQPWAEYMANDEFGLAPFPFADALLRADLGVGGLGLEINSGYDPGGTMPRTLLAVGRQLDRWALLGAPLLIALTAPSGASARGGDAAAEAGPQPLAWGTSRDPSEKSQGEWTERYLPMILAKNSVQVVLWNQLRDSDPHGLPWGGLLDSAGRAKPVVAVLRAIRSTYLSRQDLGP